MVATPLGAWLRGVSRGDPVDDRRDLALELLGPFLVLSPWRTNACRLAAVLLFMGFHLGIGLTMRLGLFAWISALAWVVFLPGSVWRDESGRAGSGSEPGPRCAWWSSLCSWRPTPDSPEAPLQCRSARLPATITGPHAGMGAAMADVRAQTLYDESLVDRRRRDAGREAAGPVGGRNPRGKARHLGGCLPERGVGGIHVSGSGGHTPSTTRHWGTTSAGSGTALDWESRGPRCGWWTRYP